jgi:hypothetical protein
MRQNILMPIMIFMTRYYIRSRSTLRVVSANPFTIFRFSILLLIAFLAGSCEKGILKLGGDLLPQSDFAALNSIDTLSAYSYTLYDDSIRSDNPAVSFLGQAFDPYFGTTNAEFVTQIRLGGQWDTTAKVIDSVKLYLHLLTSLKGTSDVIHTLKISEIAEQIYNDSTYYSNRKVPLTGYVMSGIQLKIDSSLDVVLTLPVDFGNYLIRDQSMLFYSNSKADFRSYFKGLYFQMDPSGDPLMVSLSVASPATIGDYRNVLMLFMHDNAGTASTYPFILDASNANAAYNKYSHDFSTATLGNKMIYRNTTYKDTASYLQALNGVYTKISLPGLENLKKDPSFKGIAVNKARLIVPVFFDGNDFKASTAPRQLILRYKTSSGTKFTVPDYTMSSSDVGHTFFDGKIDSVKNVYNFNIPAFVQGYLEDETGVIKPEVEVYQALSTRNAIFKANKNKTSVKFEFTYTKF